MNTKCLQHKHKVTKALMFILHTSLLDVLLFVAILISIFALQPSSSFQAFYKLYENIHLMGSEH